MNRWIYTEIDINLVLKHTLYSKELEHCYNLYNRDRIWKYSNKKKIHRGANAEADVYGVIVFKC